MSLFSAGSNLFDDNSNQDDQIWGNNSNRRGVNAQGPDPLTFIAAQRQKQSADRERNLLKPVEWLFDRLSTGNYLMANLTDQAFRSARGMDTDVWDSIVGSFTGERKKFFADVIREHGDDVHDESWFPDQKDKGTFLGNIVGNMDTAGVVGFGLDVLFDPLNYVTFGATKVARNAANKYADEVVKASLQNKNLMQKIVGGMPDKATANRAMQLIDNPQEFMKFTTSVMQGSKRGGAFDYSTKMNDLWKESYREGLRMGEDEMKKSLYGAWSEVQSKRQSDALRGIVQNYRQSQIKPLEDFLNTQDPADLRKFIENAPPQQQQELQAAAMQYVNAGDRDAFAKLQVNNLNQYRSTLDYLKSDKTFDETYDQLYKVLSGDAPVSSINMKLKDQVDDWFRNTRGESPNWFDVDKAAKGEFSDYVPESLVEKVSDLHSTQKHIEGIATGAGRVAFKVFNANVAEHMRADNAMLRTHDKFMSGLHNKYSGSSIQTAVKSVSESGPVGFLRQFFGVRNPYQRALHTIELDHASNMRWNLAQMETKVDDVFDGFDSQEELVQNYFTARSVAQERNKPLEVEAAMHARRQMGLGEFKKPEYPGGPEVTMGYDFLYEMNRDIPAGRMNEYRKITEQFVESGRVKPIDVMNEQGMLGAVDELPDETILKRATEFDRRVSSFFDQIDETERLKMAQGLMDMRESMDTYLPYVFRRGKQRVSGGMQQNRRVGGASTVEQTVGPAEAINREQRILQHVYGMSEEQAKTIIQQNGSTVVTDMKELMLRRGLHHSVMISEANMLDSMRQFGFNVRDTNIPEAMKQKLTMEDMKSEQFLSRMGLQKIPGNMSGAYSRSGPNGYDYFFDADVAKVIERSTELLKEPGKFKQMMKGYTNWWKGIATSNPGFHIRNMYSNYSMLYTEYGTKAFSPRYSYDGLLGATIGLKGPRAIQDAGKEGASAALRLQQKYGGWTLRDLIEEGRKRGIISESSRTYVNDDPIQNIMGVQGKSAVRQNWDNYSPLSQHNKLFQFSRNVGALTESSGRFQSFLMEIDELTNLSGVKMATDEILESATRKSKAILLDYDDLTKAERDWAKTIVPFYTWIRKNLTKQIQMVQNPQYWGRMATTPKLMELLDDDDLDVDQKDMPDYMREDGYFTIGKTAEGEVMTLWPNLPVFDLNQLPVAFEPGPFGRPVMRGGQLVKNVTEMSHPVFKLVSQMATGYDTFREREIQPTEEAGREWGLVMRMPKLLEFLDPILAAGNNGLGVVGGHDENGVVQFNGEIVRGVEAVFPLANALNRYINAIEEVPEQVFDNNTLEEMVDKVMNASDPYEGTQEALRAMSFGLGIKASAYDEQEARLWRSMDIYRSALDRRRVDQELQQNRDIRRKQWQNRQIGTMRRLGIY